MSTDREAISVEDLLRNARWVEALARGLLRGDAQLAEDVVQETWVAALENPPRQPGALRSWLRTTVRNLAHHKRRTEERRGLREARVARSEAGGPEPVDTVLRFERQQHLGRLVLELDEPYRSSVLLRFYEGLDYDAIGRRTGVSAGNARTRVHRAVKQLRERLDGETGGKLHAWLAPLAVASIPKTAAAAVTSGVIMKVSKSAVVLFVALAIPILGGLLAWSLGDPSRGTPPRADAPNVEEARRSDDGIGTGKSEEATGDIEEERDGVNDEESPLTRESAFTLKVQVLDPEGRPMLVDVAIYARGVGRWKLGTVRTGVDGRAENFVPEAGVFEAEASRNGSYLRRAVELSESKQDGEIVLRFPAGAAVHGEIHTTHGAIEKDVRGKFRVLGQTDLLVDLVAVGAAPSEELSYSRVDADGRYRIEGLAPGDYYLRVPGKFHAEKITISEGEAELEKNILLATGQISGHVRDRSTGEPVSGVQVVVSLRASADGRLALLRAAGLPRPSDRCAPREDGSYSFSQLPAGEYALFANGGGYGVKYANTALPEARPQAVVDFELDMGSFVQLAVKDTDGNDLENPRVSTQGMSWGFAGRVSGLKVGKWDFFATAPGYELQLRKQVPFEPGEATELTFELKREARTRITFLDGDGQPVPGVRVFIPRDGYDQQQTIAGLYRDQNLPFATTNQAGQIFVLGLAPGAYELQAKKSGYAVFDKAVKLAAESPNLRVALTSGETTFHFRLRVTSVKSGGQAAELGIRSGAVILRYDGKPIDSLAALRAAVSKAQSPTVEMVVRENATERTLTVQRGVLGVGLEEFEDQE